ncbi:hypothetical protein [Paenibacillus sp. y28]|uniref:hypothetical protein n=1 Tax=Paenibacillus sp. y28 TaxID=3129110 RepID=UPI00301B69DB
MTAVRLNNKRGQDGLDTMPISTSYTFYQKLLSWEEQSDKTAFKRRKDGQIRLRYSLTKADLQLAHALHVGVYTSGELHFSNRHQIYRKLEELHEAPVCIEQFYEAFEKFVTNGLIITKRDKVTGDYHYKLPDYSVPTKGKKDDEDKGFVPLHPIVFSRAFTQLPIAAQRWFIKAALLQRNFPNKELEWNEVNLQKIVHTHTRGQLQKLIEYMTKPCWQGTALFRHVRIEKNRENKAKLVFSLHPDLLTPYVEGTKYRDPIPGKHSRLHIQQLKRWLQMYKLEPLEHANEGATFIQLAFILKRKSQAYTHVVLSHLAALYQEHGVIPEDMVRYVQRDLHDKVTTNVLAIAKQTGVYDYISTGSEQISKRLADFAAAFRDTPLAAFRHACRKAYQVLSSSHHYSRSPVIGQMDYHRPSPWTDRMDMFRLRSMAFTLGKDPDAFWDKQHAAEARLMRGELPYVLEQWFFEQIPQLPSWNRVPDPPRGFRLEQFLQAYL